jgi:hypothetical protein
MFPGNYIRFAGARSREQSRPRGRRRRRQAVGADKSLIISCTSHNYSPPRIELNRIAITRHCHGNHHRVLITNFY